MAGQARRGEIFLLVACLQERDRRNDEESILSLFDLPYQYFLFLLTTFSYYFRFFSLSFKSFFRRIGEAEIERTRGGRKGIHPTWGEALCVPR